MLLLGLGAVLPAYGANGNILLVRSGNAAIYRQAERAFRNDCEKDPTCPAIETISFPIESTKLRQQLDAARIAVTIGQKAAEALLKTSPSIPVIQTLITSRGKILLDQASSKGNGKRTTLLLDQPISRQLLVVKSALRGKKRLGVIYGPLSTRFRPKVRTAAKKYGFSLIERYVDKGKELGAKLGTLLGSVDIILALPDPYLYNRSTLANVLLTSFRHKTPVIGFSAGFVKAGALFAIHTTPQQAGHQAKQLLMRRLRGKALSNIEFPTDFQLSINWGVAKALNIALPGKKEILRGIRP